MSGRFASTSNYSFIKRFWNVDLRDQPILVNPLSERLSEPSFHRSQ